MKTYTIEYINNGKKEKKKIEIKNKEEIIEFCERNGYMLIKAKEENSFIKFFHSLSKKKKNSNNIKILNDKDTYKIIKALYILNYAQIPPSRRLEYMQKTIKSKKLNQLIVYWNEYMTDGMEVSEALKLIGMNDYIVHSVRVGSETGEITAIYKKIMEVLENKLNTKKKIKSLMVHPLISFTLLFAMFQFYIFFYYQQVRNILKYMNKNQFPEITKILLNWSNYATSSFFHGTVFLLSSLFVFIMFFYLGSLLVKKTIIYIPGLKNVLKYEDYIVFFSLLNVALSSNILLFRAIELSSKAVSDKKLKNKLLNAVSEIESGGVSFSKLAINNAIFNKDFESEAAISNFEETTDTKHFEILIEMLQEKLNDVIKVLSSFIQPILVLIIVIVIVILQYAANAPMWTFGKGGI